SSDVRAVLDGPSYFRGMAGYALRNAPFVAGYVLDLARLPREWMPYNRVVLRLRLSDADIVEGAPFPAAQAARVPAVPAEVSRRLAGVSRGYACWIEGGQLERFAGRGRDRGAAAAAPRRRAPVRGDAHAGTRRRARAGAVLRRRDRAVGRGGRDGADQRRIRRERTAGRRRRVDHGFEP